VNLSKLSLASMALALSVFVAACGGGTSTPAPAAPAAGGSTPAPAPAPKAPVNLVIATGGTGGTYYPVGGAIAKVISEKAGINSNAQTSGGSVENIRLLDKGEVDLALAQNDLSFYAYNGVEMFNGKKTTKFLAIAGLYPEVVQIMVRESGKLNSLADLKGKKVAVGAPGSGNEATARQLFESHGMSYKDLGQVANLATKEGTDAFKNRQLDAVLVTSGAPQPSFQDVATLEKIRILPLTGTGIDAMIKKHPFYSPFVIKGGSYKGIDADTTTIAVKATLLVRTDLDTDTVYKLTKALMENLPALHASHRQLTNLTLQTAAVGVGVPLHPGAEKYYKEKGLIK
jgi:TRAP transporter TAXI family solute receptor